MKPTLLLVILLSFSTVYGSNVTLYLFYSTTCPHCHAENQFLDGIAGQYPSLTIKRYAVDISAENDTLMKRFEKAFLINNTGLVPETYVGNEMLPGYGTYNTHGKIIEEMINNCSRENCPDSLEIVEKSESGKHVNTTIIETSLIELPLIGIVDMNSTPQLLSLAAATILVFALVWMLIRKMRSPPAKGS